MAAGLFKLIIEKFVVEGRRKEEGKFNKNQDFNN
jgi:hypothetical protein